MKKVRILTKEATQIRASQIRASQIRVSQIRASQIRPSQIRASQIRATEISSNHRELHGDIFFCVSWPIPERPPRQMPTELLCLLQFHKNSANGVAWLRSAGWYDPVIIPLTQDVFFAFAAVRQFSTNHSSSEHGCEFYNSFISLSLLTGPQMIKLYPSKGSECCAPRHNKNLPTNAIQHHSDGVKRSLWGVRNETFDLT